MTNRESADEARVRVQVDLGKRALSDLDALRSSTGAHSRAEVIRSALRVYAYLIHEKSKNGASISLVKRNGGKTTEVELLDVGIWDR